MNNLEKIANLKSLTRKEEDEIMEIALRRIEQRITYDQIYYNCEHFVTECVYGTPFSFQSEIKIRTWNEEFLSKYAKLFIIYKLMVFLWSLKCIRDTTNRTVLRILSESQLHSFFDSLKSFLHLLENNPPYIKAILYVSTAVIIFLITEIIRYFIKRN